MGDHCMAQQEVYIPRYVHKKLEGSIYYLPICRPDSQSSTSGRRIRVRARFTRIRDTAPQLYSALGNPLPCVQNSLLPVLSSSSTGRDCVANRKYHRTCIGRLDAMGTPNRPALFHHRAVCAAANPTHMPRVGILPHMPDRARIVHTSAGQ